MFENTSPGSNRRFAASLGNAGRVFGPRRILSLAMFLVLPAVAQSPSPSPKVFPGQTADRFGQQQPDSISGIDGRIEARRITLLNLLRQKSMVSDAEKLLRLAQELDNDAKDSASAMSPADRMRKAAEIERLAKEVREKMTYTVGVPTEPAPPFAVYSR